MTNADIERVRQGWAIAAAVPDTAAATFYGHFFRIDPASRALFTGDMAAQGRALARTLDYIVDMLDDEKRLAAAARDLAPRLVAFGVVPEQYGLAGEALIRTLHDLHGHRFDAEDRAAWERVCSAVEAVVLEAIADTQNAPDRR